VLRRENWSGIKLIGCSAPMGDRAALDDAKRELAPFQPEHRDGLLHLCPCESCAEKFIVDIAVKFNTRKLLIESAPRLATMQHSFERVWKAARNLADELEGMDDYSRDYLINLDDFDRLYFGRLYQASAASKLPSPETDEHEASDGVFVETLLSLANYVSARSKHLAENCHVSAPIVDKGGDTNVIKQRFGSAGSYLVGWCWSAFENFQPETATATDNGPFVRFVNAVYSYATGEIEENSTLLNWIKKLAKPHRQYYRCLRHYGRLESELEDLQADAATVASGARIIELKNEMEIALQALSEATRALNRELAGVGKIPMPT